MHTSISSNLVRSIALGAIALSAIAFAGSSAFASSVTGTLTTAQGTTSAPVCIVLTHGLLRGSRDGSSGGDVTSLQNFLYRHGYLAVAATGYFGPLTASAVTKFQSDNGISAIGIVGPMTRAAIQKTDCGMNPQPTNISIYNIAPTSGPVGTSVSITGFGFTGDNTIHFGSGAIVHVPITSSIAIACTTNPDCHGGINQTITFTVPAALNPLCYYSGCMMPSMQTVPGTYDVYVENANGTSAKVSFTVTSTSTNGPSITSIAPTSGPIGTTVTLNGSGFTMSDRVQIGSGVIAPSSVVNGGTQITFSVPQVAGPYCPLDMACPAYVMLITPGSYNISVKDESTGNASNSVTYTVTSGSSNQAPIITGIDTPSTLSIGTTGTWTVHASVPSGSTTNLHYSVVWGDEGGSGSGSFAAPASTNVESSATFTHAYQISGTYTPTFTVTNDSGQSATVRSTINVTPLY